MAAAAQRPKLVVIAGPTASGKSELAMRLAKEFNGEIICADSRTVYQGMDIGTAKPTAKDRREVAHWGLDLIKPGEAFSAAKFKAYAEDKIKDVQKRGKLPILAGGTGLYIDSLVFDFSFVPTKKPAPYRRLMYSWYSVDKLQKIIQQRDWPMPENSRNRRHLVAALSRRGRQGSRRPSPKAMLLVGLMPPDDVLKARIAKRAQAMFKDGIVQETRTLRDKYGQRKLLAGGAIIYRLVLRFINGEISQQQARKLFETADWQYARRQRTWFRRNRHIKWFNTPDEAYKAVKKQLLNT